MDKGIITNKKPQQGTKTSKYLPQLNINHQIDRLISDKKQLTEIVCLTSYPPRECGIATYSKDLEKALMDKFGDAFKLTVYPLESQNFKHSYPRKVEGTLNTDSALDFLQAAYQINSNPRIGLVLIQHEFGLFNTNEGSFYEFLEYMDKPVILTFHTVLPDPSNEVKEKVSKIAAHCASIIVMTHT
ncbi:MAG: hypothetical protein HKN31_13340, partial [Pricia sp.]|nr:hypothetical protein [Pricia sp.]